MLVREFIYEFERGGDPKEMLGIGSDFLIKKFKDEFSKDRNFYEQSSDYKAKDTTMYIVLFHDDLKTVSRLSIEKIKYKFNDSPYFEFGGLEEVNVDTLDLKYRATSKRLRQNVHRVILKFKWK